MHHGGRSKSEVQKNIVRLVSNPFLSISKSSDTQCKRRLFSDIQLWPFTILQSLELKGWIVSHLKTIIIGAIYFYLEKSLAELLRAEIQCLFRSRKKWLKWGTLNGQPNIYNLGHRCHRAASLKMRPSVVIRNVATSSCEIHSSSFKIVVAIT